MSCRFARAETTAAATSHAYHRNRLAEFIRAWLCSSRGIALTVPATGPEDQRGFGLFCFRRIEDVLQRPILASSTAVGAAYPIKTYLNGLGSLR